jgi:hypothetical protein
LRHFLYMIVFAALAATAFGTIGRETRRDAVAYGLKIFAEFVGIGLALAWILYWLPL